MTLVFKGGIHYDSRQLVPDRIKLDHPKKDSRKPGFKVSLNPTKYRCFTYRKTVIFPVLFDEPD